MKPTRVKSLHGIPQPTTSIGRTCQTCGAGFAESFSSKGDGMAGVWTDCGRWYCSEECAPDRPAAAEGNET